MLLCDTHVHVFDPERFAYTADRRFTPPPATVAQLNAFHAALGVSHAVLVQPSVYGHDHRCILDALRSMPGRAKGVVVLGKETYPQTMADMEAAGVCGNRVNLAVDGIRDRESAERLVLTSLLRAPGKWHLQLHANLETISAISHRLKSIRQTVVFDHFGLPDVFRGTQHSGWQDLLDLASTGRVFVKLSAPYMGSRQAPLYPDMQPFVESLARHAPDALLWGSNWPHTKGSTRTADASPLVPEAFRIEDDAGLLSQLTAWLGPSLSTRVFVDNPARLYGFVANFINQPTALGASAHSRKPP
jgi:2-pyrone-4,6-dicarboxylate lactonase